MNIKDELHYKIVGSGAYIDGISKVEAVMLDLFRDWALEMVGEDEWTTLTVSDFVPYHRDELRKEIRQRIEEEI